MERKTCGDCIFYHGIYDDCGVCTLCETDETFDKTCDFVYACKKFQPAPKPTNGDVIRQMGNTELAELIVPKVMFCDGCPVKCAEKDIPKIKDNPFGADIVDDVCKKRVEAWLNAPAESEGKDE